MFFYNDRNTPVLKYFASPSTAGNLRVKNVKYDCPSPPKTPSLTLNTCGFAYNYTCMLITDKISYKHYSNIKASCILTLIAYGNICRVKMTASTNLFFYALRHLISMF